MTDQKIIILDINAEDGVQAMAQIQEAAGPGSWRIVTLLDLRDTQGFVQWHRGYEARGRRVLVVLEPAGVQHAGRLQEGREALLH